MLCSANSAAILTLPYSPTLDTSFLNTAPNGTVSALSLAAWVVIPFPRANVTRVLLYKNAAFQWQISTGSNRTGVYSYVCALYTKAGREGDRQLIVSLICRCTA